MTQSITVVEDHHAAGRAELPPPPPGKSGWPWIAPAGADEASAAFSRGADWPTITIVIPSYNQGRFIEETIRSILLQGYPRLELMVMDGASKDETVELLRRYDRWISFWESEPDRGQTHAINKGLARATGEIFAYLNSDDLLAPGALRRIAEGFRENPGVELVHGACIYVDEAGAELFTIRGRLTGFLDYLRIWDRLARREFLTQPEVFCRTRSLVDAGAFREDLHSVMDFEMWLRLLQRGARFQAIDAPVAMFRTYPTQKSSVDPGDELCSVVEEYIVLAQLPAAEERTIREDLRRARAHLLVRAGISATILDHYGDAVRYCIRAAAVDRGIMGTYQFWAVLANPAKRVVPVRVRSAIQTLFGVKAA